MKGASLQPLVCTPAVSVILSVNARTVTHSCTVPEQYQRQPAPMTAPRSPMVPYDLGHMLLFPGPAGEGEQQVCEEDKDERGMLPITPGKATRMYGNSSADRMRVTVTHQQAGPAVEVCV